MEIRSKSFRREAELVSQLQHPSIVPIHDYGILLDGSAFFVMKLVEGRTLSELLSTRPTPEEELPRLVKIFEQICQGVAYAHFKKPERVLHRDLKPQNVMVGAFGEVMVMDWGIAKLLADRHESLDVSIRAKENRSNNELTSTVKKEPSTGGGMNKVPADTGTCSRQCSWAGLFCFASDRHSRERL